MTELSEQQLLSAADMERALTRIAHEVVERNRGLEELAVIGVRTRGVPLARRLLEKLQATESGAPELPSGAIDITLYRDDALLGLPDPVLGRTEIPFSVTGKNVLLVDDVLYTGRTVRAALDALMALGRPRAVWLAVMVDRGHRELPIHADFVGLQLQTQAEQSVRVLLEDPDGREAVVLRTPSSEVAP